jgi:ribosomal-protein-alanine N-acetyltransferase
VKRPNTKLPGLWAARVRLRSLQVGDTRFLAMLDSDPLVMRFIHRGALSYDASVSWAELQIENATKYQPWPRRWGKWIVQIRRSHVPIGWVEVSHLSTKLGDFPCVGYQFAPAFWGCGYGTEAVFTVVDYLFRQRKERFVFAYARPENLASTRVLEKVGFTKLARKIKDDGRNWCAVYEVRRTGWRKPVSNKQCLFGVACGSTEWPPV